MVTERVLTSYPLSSNERVAMLRYVASLRSQLQDLSELFSSRYGQHSSFADLSAKALVCTTLLEHELQEAEQRLENEFAEEAGIGAENRNERSSMMKTAFHS
jgi:hypothetical protein